VVRIVINHVVRLVRVLHHLFAMKRRFYNQLIGVAMFAAIGCNSGEAPSTDFDAGPDKLANCVHDDNGQLIERTIDFSCADDSDCEQKDVRSGCGTYPRCVSRHSAVPEFTCHEGTGTCGYPEIEYCKCREQVCRSMREDKEI
jgi:hypothetical protein